MDDARALIEAHIPLAEKLAWETCILRGLPQFFHKDVRAAALLGLVQAGVAFDPARGYRFATFARWRIVGAMLDQVRKEQAMVSGGDMDTLPGREEFSPEAGLPGIDLDRMIGRTHLSPREQTVLAAVLGGKTGREIGRQLGVSEEWISEIRSRVVRKLRASAGVANADED
jgi:RNA polymerase sigma factor (sigma-70 family)